MRKIIVLVTSAVIVVASLLSFGPLSQADAATASSCYKFLYVTKTTPVDLARLDCLTDAKGTHIATFQKDGNFVVRHGATATWSSQTANKQALKLSFQGDGNIVIYGQASVLWQDKGYIYGQTHTVSYYSLEMQSDGNLVEYAHPANGGVQVAVWSSGTAGQ